MGRRLTLLRSWKMQMTFWDNMLSPYLIRRFGSGSPLNLGKVL